MAASLLAHWATREKWGSELCFLWTETPRALLWGQLSYGWTCTPLWLQWKLRIRCLQPAQGQWPQLRAWFWLLPMRGRICGEGSGWREEEWIMLFPADSTALSCFLLSQLNDICTSCSQKESLWWNVTGFSMNDPSPSFTSLPAASRPPLKCLFFILRGHCLEIQVQEKVITFSLQVCLSKKPPNHLWLKHRDYSRGKMLLVAALPASLSGFYSPIFSHAKASGDSMVDCCCLPAFLATLGGLRPSPSGGQSSRSVSPK